MAKERYRWSQQPNGRYTIYDVPIFSVYADDEKGTADTRDLDEIVSTFRRQREDGYYPRLHLGHQKRGKTEVVEGKPRHVPDVSNAPGIGYLDQVHRDGDILRADFVEISPENFERFREGDFPGRSIELHPTENLIEGVAILESRPPFFRFPVLFLEPEATEGAETDEYYSVRHEAIIFQEENMNLMDMKGGGAGDEIPEAIPPENDKLHQCYQDSLESSGQVNQKLDKLVELISALLGAEEREAEAEGYQDEEMGDMVPPAEGEEDEEGVRSDKPEPVAMQSKSGEMARLYQRIAVLEGRKDEESHLSRLRKICDENPSVDFEWHKEKLLQFQGSCRKNFLDFVEESASESWSSEHPAKQFARSGEARLSSIEDTFRQRPAHVREIVKRAARDYRDTVTQKNRRNAELFQKQWGSQEQFVAKMADLEEAAPGTYNQIFS